MSENIQTVEINGNSLDRGQTCTVDHHVTTLQVQIRSLGIINKDWIKRKIQERYEVVGEVTETGSVYYVHAGMSDFVT